jgi:UDPglucose 6-dehydrogenase
MRVCVYGLWHLGSVTAACLAEHTFTVGHDPDEATLLKLLAAQPPVFEPGLVDLLQACLSTGRLSFNHNLASSVLGADIVWVTFDTPLDEREVGDVEFIERQVEALFPHLRDGVLVLISSQVPVGFTAKMEKVWRSAYPDRKASFAYSPENLRLGRALDAFRHPERVVVGTRSREDQDRLGLLFAPFCSRVEWMSVESAEVTKHAVNAFLATSITFINEVAGICEQVGADAKEVERGLKSEPRVGPRAYLSPGSGFAGGTLARDVAFLTQTAKQAGIATTLLSAVPVSNDNHKGWPRRKLKEMLGEVSGKTVAVLGLTYKPGTDSLRCSSAVETCLWLSQQGATVRAYDPAINQLPPELSKHIRLCGTTQEALKGADALLVATEWPMFRTMSIDELVREMRAPIVVDPSRFLNMPIDGSSRLHYIAVGKPREPL